MGVQGCSDTIAELWARASQHGASLIPQHVFARFQSQKSLIQDFLSLTSPHIQPLSLSLSFFLVALRVSGFVLPGYKGAAPFLPQRKQTFGRPRSTLTRRA